MYLVEEKELNELIGHDTEKICSIFTKYPLSILSNDLKEMGATNKTILSEFGLISRYYDIYKYGTRMVSEGTNGNYIGAALKFKKSAQLINKEARFLFGEVPDITAYIDGKEKTKDNQIKNNVDLCNKLIQKIIDKTKFKSKLLKAAKDCFVGKRVALVANFNEEKGITLNFIKSTDFIYENSVDDPENLEKFIAIVVLNDSDNENEKLIFKKKYIMDDGVDEDGNEKRMCFIEEVLYNGAGREIEVVTEYTQTSLDRIPAVVILNDALLDDDKGVSEIFELVGGEAYYNKMSNGDIDAERKEMAQIRYTIDMDADSTKNLSVAPGSYWDLQTDMNKENPHPAVGTLSSNMSYSGALEKTMKRIEGDMHDTIDMPFIDLESMSGVITSGKSLKAIYWPLIMRSKEKMLEWGPALQYIFKLIIDAAIIYEDITLDIIDQTIAPMNVSIEVVQNLPLPEDEETEKNIDIQEVTAQVMSRKSYMKKWYQLTDAEAEEELKQIALERQMLEESYTEQTYGDIKDGEEDITVEDIEEV